MDSLGLSPDQFIAHLSRLSPKRGTPFSGDDDLKAELYRAAVPALETIWAGESFSMPADVKIDPGSSFMEAVFRSDLTGAQRSLRRHLLREIFWDFEEGARALPLAERQVLDALVVERTDARQVRFCSMGAAGIGTAIDNASWAVVAPLDILFKNQDVPWVRSTLLDAASLEALSKGFFKFVRFLTTEHIEIIALLQRYPPIVSLGDETILLGFSPSFLDDVSTERFSGNRYGCPAQFARAAASSSGGDVPGEKERTIAGAFISWFHDHVAREVWRQVASSVQTPKLIESL